MARDLIAPPEKQTPGGRGTGALSFLKELPILIALALGIALVIKALLVQAFYIPSESMVPTLHIGDRVLVNKLTYRFHQPRRGDIVVFKDPYGAARCPRNARADEIVPADCTRSVLKKGYDWFAELFGLPTGSTKDYIKRVVGLPGETIEMRSGEVYIDGHLIDFPSTPSRGPRKDSYSFPPEKIPRHSYFVMGDNRGNSSDSRVFKAITRNKIIGRAFVLLWPPRRFGGL
jgi:signal peptidase I